MSRRVDSGDVTLRVPRWRARRVVRAILGVLALEGALALLILIAANPPPQPFEVRLSLPVPPRADPPPREVVVAIANPPPPAPMPTRWWHTPILAFRPTPLYLAELTDGALAPAVAPTLASSAVDRLVPARAPVAPARESARPAAALATAPDRTQPSPRTIASLREHAIVLFALADVLEAGPLALPFEMVRAPAPDGASAADGMIAATPHPVALVRIALARSAPSAADHLAVSARAPVMRDETAWSAAAPQAPSDLLRPELLPTARPSPAVLLARWLPELDSPARTAPLKTEFVRQVLPLIMQVNEAVLQHRERIYALSPGIEAGRPLSEADQRVVAEILQVARLEIWDREELLLRLDAVPLSMALAQAGLESGWGTSRGAREDNALFGQMMFAPASLPRIQPFGDLLETVQAYQRNLNTHWAYVEFRRRRAALRARGDTLDGHALAAFIQRYSERGPLYIEAVRQLMRANNLSLLDATVIDAALDDTLGLPVGVTPTAEEAPLLEPALALEPATTPDSIESP